LDHSIVKTQYTPKFQESTTFGFGLTGVFFRRSLQVRLVPWRKNL